MERTCFVQTIKDRCRMCFTCVRECPSKAIRIIDGQAEVMPERCIGCGNCVRVCSQEAKKLVKSIDEVEILLASKHRVAAIIAPSFPAEFSEYDFPTVVGLIEGLGFDIVCEVAFGADLVADRYRRLLSEKTPNKYIAANCPAVVNYIEKYYPEIVKNIAPIVSPMVASARSIRQIYGKEYKVVFIGPCIAKKIEAQTDYADTNVHVAITFSELREMLNEHAINEKNTNPTDFDQPHPSLGTLLPINRGLLQAANISEDLVSGEVVAADGLSDFTNAIEEFSKGNLDLRLLEMLSCNGCIMGPGMTCGDAYFQRRSRISDYARYRAQSIDRILWRQNMDRLAGLDLTRTYQIDDQRIPVPNEKEIKNILKRMGKLDKRDELNCGACGYHTCREHAIAIYKGIAESEMCLPYTIDKIKETAEQLSNSYQKLEKTQQALIQSEKLASMGQLAAGIAHEVNNPLGIVLLYAHMMLEKCPDDSELHNDLSLIVKQADRCKNIVGGLLNFARKNRINRKEVEIHTLISDAIKSVVIPKNIRIQKTISKTCDTANIDCDQISQVLTNILTNAIEAMPEGGNITITANSYDTHFNVDISDEGTGISEAKKKMVFEPFFTTKKLGKGTGLGLAVVYGIIKMHHGNISVESNDDPSKGATGSTFSITIPKGISTNGISSAKKE